jgi:hypothetical protein
MADMNGGTSPGPTSLGVDTWILGLYLRALHLAREHGGETDPGQYAIGVSVACRHGAQDRYDMTPNYRTQGLSVHAQSGYNDASAVIATAMEQGVPPSGEYERLLPALGSG